MRLGVDAINLRADSRGMGRLVRGMLRAIAPHVAITLLMRDMREVPALASELPASIAFAPLGSARRRDRYDAVWFPWNAIRFGVAAPSLATVCDDFAFRYPAGNIIARMREQGPIRRALREARALTTISTWSQRAIAERFQIGAERIEVLPLAPDPFFFRAFDHPHVAQPFVLIVADSEPRKNLRAFANDFTAAFPHHEMTLVVVGRPNAHDREHLRHIGAIVRDADDDSLRGLYRTARAVAVPSLGEGFGLVAAEAQACGAPVIAANTSALPESVGDAGVLVGVDDRAAWVEKLRRVCGDDAFNAQLRSAANARWLKPRDGAADALRARLTRLVDDGT